MPSVGKSTAGVVLAKRSGRTFIDTDLLLQQAYGCLLPALIERLGTRGFLDAENRLLAELNAGNAVIATGGSAVYAEDGMRRLKALSAVVYLQAPPEILESRLGQFSTRGVVTLGARTVAELYDERQPLYRKWADMTVPACGTLDRTVELLLAAVGQDEPGIE